ncbi:MAG: hypothetical protein C0515_09360 [Novosphingobium sp.]|nr:hypothetical protein [Novosphingobium sp.]
MLRSSRCQIKQHVPSGIGKYGVIKEPVAMTALGNDLPHKTRLGQRRSTGSGSSLWLNYWYSQETNSRFFRPEDTFTAGWAGNVLVSSLQLFESFGNLADLLD